MEAVLMKRSFRKQNSFGYHGQAIVEFAIALPILLALLVGILEVGRMLFIYAAVTNASREAVRYASAVGLDDSGSYKNTIIAQGSGRWRGAPRTSHHWLLPSPMTMVRAQDRLTLAMGLWIVEWLSHPGTVCWSP